MDNNKKRKAVAARLLCLALALVLGACPERPHRPDLNLVLDLPAGRGRVRIDDMAAEAVPFLQPLDGARYILETPASYLSPPQRYRVEEESLRRRLKDGIERVRLRIAVRHRLPLPLEIGLALAVSPQSLTDRPDLFLPPTGRLPMAAADPADRREISRAMEFELEKEEIELFLRTGGLYGGVEIFFPPAAGTVVVNGSDFAALEVELRLLVSVGTAPAAPRWPTAPP